MTAVRVGTDVQPIEEVAESLRTHGTRYAERLFTEQEIAASGGCTEQAAPGLAARFAAKEAMMKVLGTTARTPLPREIEVVPDSDGVPRLHLHTTAAELAAEAGLLQWDLSLSHADGIAVATVVALAEHPRGGAR